MPTQQELRDSVNNSLQKLIDVSVVLRARYPNDTDVEALATDTHSFYQAVLAERAEADK